MKKVIGIIGGVGAGKSQVLDILEREFDAKVMQADSIAHELMEPARIGYIRLTESMGTGFLGEDGRIDRSKLSALIFGDEGKRKMVDDIIHPLVWEAIKHRIAVSDKQLVAVETALPQKEFDDICHELWYVYTSRSIRVRRLMEGRGYTMERCESIVDSQLSEREFRDFCDFEINNDGTWEETRKQVIELLDQNI